MPRKNKKSKASKETKVSELENDNSKFLKQSETATQKKDTVASEADSEKQEKQGCLLSLDKKLKLQLKKQKKKEKKQEFESSKSKTVEEVNSVVETQGENSEILQDGNKCKVTLIDGSSQVKEEVAVPVSPMVIISEVDNSENESNKANVLLKPVEDDADKTGQQEFVKGRVDFDTIKHKPCIETIPEDLFEEFIENEEIIQTKEAIRAFPRTSPLSSPKFRKKDLSLMEIVVSSPPKVFYNYHGVPYRECLSKPVIIEDIQDGIVVLQNFKAKEDELISNRKLDVIVEESSDFSDASGNSEKKCHAAKLKNDNKGGHATVQPLLRKTVKIYSLNEENENDEGSDGTSSGDTYIICPEIAETLKMSNDVVKIELAESESEGDFEIIQSETSDGASEIEVICLEKSDVFGAKTEDNLKQVKEVDCSDVSSWSIKSISSDFNGQIEEGSESWRSSLNRETGNSAEGDIESDLDSQKACIFGEFDDDLNFIRPDILSNKNDETEFFLRQQKNISDMDISKVEPYYNFSKLCKLNDGIRSKEDALEEIKENKMNGSMEGLETKNLAHDETEYPKVNVKNLAEAIKGDMDKILMTKIKWIQHSDEPDLSETSWVNLLEETKSEMGKKGIKRNNSKNSLKVKDFSSSSSYENVVKSNKKVTLAEPSLENFQNPDALANLAEKKVLTLPYGKLILKKIGLGSCCSNDCNKGAEEDMYVKTNNQQSEAPACASPVPSEISVRSLRGSVSSRSKNCEDDLVSESDKSYIEFDYSNPRLGQTEKWYGSKTDVPAVFLGFSPSQKKIYEETSKKAMPDEAEAASLLDLHQKFLERRCYNESFLHGKSRNLIFNSKGKNTQPKPVVITEIATPDNKVLEYLKRSSPEIAERKEKDSMKEMRNNKGEVQSPSELEFPTKEYVMRLVENKKAEIINDLRKLKDYNEGSNRIENHHDEENQKKRETDENGQESEVVGNSCLLAILQNAISDEFVPELKADSSIKCSSESHEVSLLTNHQTMSEAWQSNKIFEGSTKKRQENGKNDIFEEDRQTFEHIWNKEKGITLGERKINPATFDNVKNRPKTICLGNSTDNNINEAQVEKKFAVPKDKPKADANEDLIITENLPAVSDVIRAFEEPQLKEPQNLSNGQANRKTQIHIDNEKYQISKKGDIALISNGAPERRKQQKEKRKSLPVSILSDEEVFKQKMYDEYMSKLAERIERRQQKSIRVSQSNEIECSEEIRFFDLENEFINKVKERREKMNMAHDKKETEESQKAFMESLQRQCQEFSDYWKEEISHLENGKINQKEENEFDRCRDGTESSATSKRSSVQLIFDSSSNVESLPKHLQEFLMVDEEEFPDLFDGKFYDNMPSSVVISPNFKATAPRPGVWSPAQGVQVQKTEIKKENEERKRLEDEPIPPVWTPKASPILEKKEFRPVNFESPTLPRKKYIQDDKRESSVPPPWQQPGGDKLPELAKSPSSPALILPRAPNPTVTLLQKAREGHLPRGAHYLNSNMNDSPAPDGTSIEKLEIVSTIKNERPRKVEIAPKKITGIGPTTKEGIPLVLRSEVTEENKEKWYKRMYDSLHKAGQDDDYVTVKYRTSPSRKGIYNYEHTSRSGYQSEPESITYDLSTNKYVTLDRRRVEKSKEDDYACITLPRSRSSPPRRDFVGYKNQPGRIEDYEPGRSSISEAETNKWWDEVLEIFDKWLEYNPESPDPAYNKLLIDAIKLRREEGKSKTVQKTPVSPRSFTNFASGYISDPQYVYKRTDEEVQSPNSEEQKEAYRIIQKGGEIPLKGLRKPAPARPKDNLETEIEYFPLSPTLTRIRVHKQNITPLSDFPLYKSPATWNTTLNYPTVPFGVCSSFSQVQIFPPPFTQFLTAVKPQEPVSIENRHSESDFLKKPQKFSVQLQNISGPDDYVQIIPKPRCRSKKSPIYANLLVQEEDLPGNCDKNRERSPVICKDSRHSEVKDIEPNKKKSESTSNLISEKKVGFATFSDLKRIAPSVISTSVSKVSLNKILNKPDQQKSGVHLEKKGSLISQLTPKSTSHDKKTKIRSENKENKENIIQNKDLTDQAKKREKKKSLLAKPKSSKIVKAVKGTGKVPLSESTQREKPLSKTSKRFKTFSNSLKKKKESEKFSTQFEDVVESKNRCLETDANADIIQYISRFVESEANSTYVDLKNPEDLKPQVCFDIIEEEEQEEEADATMSPIYESLDDGSKAKHSGDVDVTEVFRSRSFSPDVRRKIYKLPDMNKPIPPKRKQSKNSPTLKMWSKMMVSYPSRKSRSDEYNSNVKFLQEKIKRKLKDEKDSKPEFGDDIETVRTVKKDKNGSMSIKTDRYVRLSSPPSSGALKTRSTYPDIERRKKLLEPKTKFRSLNTLSSRKYSDASTITKSSNLESSKKQKAPNPYLKSSITYSVRNSNNEEEDKKKSLKVNAAISSKAKEPMNKTTTKKDLVFSKTSSSPCPSITSSKSARSGKSPSSDKGSLSPKSPQRRFFSPNSSASRLSSPSRSVSPGSTTSKPKLRSSLDLKRVETAKTLKTKVIPKIPLPQKTSAKKLAGSNVVKSCTVKDELRKKSKKIGSFDSVESSKALKKMTDNEKIKSVVQKKPQELIDKLEEENEVVRGRDLVRTDSFFQNLFLRGPVDGRPIVEVERLTSVLERARRYQRRINWPEVYKSEPSLSLLTYYLNQKRPVSLSRFRHLERDYSSRSHSPLGSWHSENFQIKLKRFDSMSQFGDSFYRDYSPEGKERSSSEPPLHRSQINSPENGFDRKSRISNSEVSSMRSSPNSSRSPSCRRIRSYKTSLKALENSRDIKKMAARARSAGEIEELKSKSDLSYGNLGKSSSSLNLSNLSDHTEYQAYVLELMHSTRKCERFRELHKFYSNLERMGKLEKTASTGDLRPRLKNEEIIDFDRWKKIRTKERAEAELKTLVDNLVKVQKEKDLLFRAADVETVRWKGDRGLRIKERSVEDLKEQFDRLSQDELEFKKWKDDLELRKDNYKSLWKGNSIADVAGNLNNPVISHRGRPITLEELQKIEDANARIGNEYGHTLKAWKNLSNEQINLLKEQLSEIYARDVRKGSYENLSDSPYKYEILVPQDSEVKSPGEGSLQVRCSSAMSKSQTFTPTIKRKENLRKELKKSESVSVISSATPESSHKVSLHPLPWKEEIPTSSKIIRSHSESRSPRSDHIVEPRSKSASSKPLTENEKKHLSMTLSREVIEKMTKSSGQGPLLPRETLGASAIARSDLRELPRSSSKDGLDFPLNLQHETRDFGIVASERSGKAEAIKSARPAKIIPASSMELESGSGSSDASIKTVIRRNSVDVLKRVQYFEDLQHAVDEHLYSDLKDALKKEVSTVSKENVETGYKLEMQVKPKKEKKKTNFVMSSSLENINDYFGHQKQYATSSLQSKQSYKKLPVAETSKAFVPRSPSDEDFYDPRNYYEDRKWIPYQHHSISPLGHRGGSNDSLFSFRSRSVSPDPTKYYRAYLRMVKCGAVRKLCNKFESWEDILSLSSDKDFWLPPAPRRFASDPELTRDLLRRFGTDPTKVTIRGQEVGDVRWLRTKFEKDMRNTRGRSRFRRARSPLMKSPITASDRYMPRINVISKKAELQLQGLNQGKGRDIVLPSSMHELAASPEGYKTLIDYTKDHGGYYYTGEVEKLRRKFERLQEAERLSILGQMYTSTPDVNELRDIAPYLECSWVAHRYPRAFGSPEYQTRLRAPSKKVQPKPRPHSSSPIRTKQLSSILKQPHPPSDRSIFADQKYDPSIHRPKYRYQPEREVERRSKRGDPDWWRHWNKPTVTFKEIVNFDFLTESHEKSPESPRKYVESEVTIHYKSPVRSEAKAMLSEDELARRQAESMKRIYKEERRRKYLQELQDMNSRRHTDNFIPSQKSPIPLNRYDDFPFNDPSLYTSKSRDYTTDPVLVARGLYDFVGRRPRELAFRRGDIIFIIRRLDKNWCEGELNGAVGLFPLSYVEVIPYNEINMKYGRARAKYDFVPQTSLELAANKGDMITLIRKIDENWFEGRIGDKTGIIPASYCHILAMPQASRMPIRAEKVNKPVAAPAAHSLIHNGSGLSSKHYYAPYLSGPSSPGRSTISSASANYHDGHVSADMLIDEALMQLDEEFDLKRSATHSATQPLNVRINPRPEPVLYQVMFSHVPNNDDELELVQGETVSVIEKCGDGWYIGSKTSDGKLGIFPGTHVRRIAPEFV